MKISKSDAENLDKIIHYLSGNNILNTVPEILDGYSTFPVSGSGQDLTYRHYEDILVNNDICSVVEEENAMIGGCKGLALESAGRMLVLNGESIVELSSGKRKKKHTTCYQQYQHLW